jgi:hypothetical protein
MHDLFIYFEGFLLIALPKSAAIEGEQEALGRLEKFQGSHGVI